MNARTILDAVAAGLTAAAAAVPDPIGKVALLGVAGAAKAAKAQIDASEAGDKASAKAIVEAWIGSLPAAVAGSEDAEKQVRDVVGEAAPATTSGIAETLP